MSIPSPSPELGHHSDGETSPFLSREPSDPLAPSQPEDSDGQNSGLPKSTRLRLLITLIVILLSFEIGGQLITGPMVRVIETIACDNYWRRHDPARLPATGLLPEHLCKIAPVQVEVATIKGYSDLLEGLLCAICAIPYGILADRYGRRRAIRLTVPGFLLNALITNSVLWFSNALPLPAIWLAAFSWIIGGGPSVALIVIWTMLADLTTDAQRATLFFRVGLVSQIASFFASAISSGLMTVNPWIPLLGGCGTVMIGLCCALSLPETMNTVSKTAESEQPLSDEPLSTCECSLGSEPVHRVLLSKIVRLIRPYLFIFNRRLLLLLFSFGTVQVAQTSSSFLTQYISTRFTLTLARAHFLTSFHMAITIPVFLFLLPLLSNKVLYSLSLPRRDLQVARFSDIALILGSLGIGLSPSIVLLIPSICLHATGAGFSIVTRSLVTALVKREETARLYSAIELMQMMGGVLGSLCFTNAFNSGLRMSGIGAGLVWILGSLLYALVGIALAFVRV
ncbi:MFS transporter [Penicillium canescens]|uniref:MFS transporter n=1 Tax=Penicillium canescens TaxID=5083 RepID=A0AAD6ILZ8_PENCN|nr:MFS transporter [Penicillium canescens]KAJ6018705.1 MFS transporter [Penicillium canescens]KAJ6033947.1 MFS transporter [Penicillium canescens]KAJ6056865.1 MFS transporter [Penicillium canescens]KAJ6058174.1 MFS transporter [Penicillium canescens]KAJ6072097.1 MFS transporter [Penicillium canescens]